jgi:hypothetical protein
MPFSNPFAHDTEGTRRNITVYKVLSIVSWLLQFAVTLYYVFDVPGHGALAHRSVPGVSNVYVTPFTISPVFVAIYWVVLWVYQAVYVWHLFRSDEVIVSSAAAVGSHFILYNLLHFAWVILWTHGINIIAEVIVVINFLQLTAVYFRYPTAPRMIHVAVSALPITFTYFLLFWNGAAIFHSHSLASRIIANIAVWGIAAFAGFFLLAFKDYYVGFATAFLAAGLGVEQFYFKVIALQWPFAFAVMAITFFASLAVAAPAIAGRTSGGSTDERAPLLQGEV